MATKDLSIEASALFEEDDVSNQIIIPQSGPLQLRNDCNSGRWKIGNQEIGDKLRFIPLGFERFFGDLGVAYATKWMQIFFVPIAGSSEGIPLDMLCVTYLKTESYNNFDNLQKIESGRNASNKNWNKGIWSAHFAKRQKSGGDGVNNYYAIEFTAEPLDFKNLAERDLPHIQKLLATQKAMKESGDSVYNYLHDPATTMNMMKIENDTQVVGALPANGQPMKDAAIDPETGLVDQPF